MPIYTSRVPFIDPEDGLERFLVTGYSDDGTTWDGIENVDTSFDFAVIDGADVVAEQHFEKANPGGTRRWWNPATWRTN